MNKQYIYIGSSFLEELYITPPVEPAKEASASDKASQKVARIRKAYGSKASTEQKATQLDRLFVVGPHNFMSHKIYEEGVDFERKEIGLKNFEGYGNRFNKIAIPIRKVLDEDKIYGEEEELEDDYEESDYEEESGESLEEAGSKFYVYTSNGDKESPGLDYYKQQNAAKKAADISIAGKLTEMWAKKAVGEYLKENTDWREFLIDGYNSDMW
jgi:hypothetical protein